MIKSKKLVPEVYYDHSRDFQLIGRIYEVVFNYLKTNIDTIYNMPSADTLNSEELELLSTTLGFKSKHNYPINQLRAICGCMSEILKNKGTRQSIYNVLNAMLRAEGIEEPINLIEEKVEVGEKEIPTGNLIIYVPSDLKDINIFKDLLDYILPVGTSISISRHSLLELTRESTLTTDSAEFSTGKKSYKTSYVPTYEQGEDMVLSDIKGGRIDNSVIVPYDPNADYSNLDEGENEGE